MCEGSGETKVDAKACAAWVQSEEECAQQQQVAGRMKYKSLLERFGFP